MLGACAGGSWKLRELVSMLFEAAVIEAEEL
jgi:hypothetical protein